MIENFEEQLKINMLRSDVRIERIYILNEEIKQSFKELADQIKAIDIQLAKTDIKINKLAKMYGGVSNNFGDVAEEFYYNSLKSTMTFNKIYFDFIDKNISRTSGKITDEYNIMMINGKDIIIEFKYKAHEADLDKLISRKYNNYNKHLVLATFNINDLLKNKALADNISILRRKEDLI